MNKITLYPHQEAALKLAEGRQNVAFYHDMGLGKTYTGAEQLIRCGNKVNLVICQKSKVNDWVEHFKDNYSGMLVLNLTNKDELKMFLIESQYKCKSYCYMVGVINYELIFRRNELKDLKDFTLLLDESSLIQNEKAKRSKFILNLKPANVILLSGSPTGGKYERLYSQLKLLGMPLSKTAFYNTYINYHFEEYAPGVKTLVVDGYKNVDRLKRKMREYGCQFLKTDEVINLPEQIFTKVRVDSSKEYKKFRKTKVVKVDDTELVGDTTFTKLLYERQLCGQYSKEKLQAFEDLLNSTNDRLIVFYNFTEEVVRLMAIARSLGRHCSVVNGNRKDLSAYEDCDNSVTFIQYQAGAMGLNLQKANKIIYYSPPLSSELYEQSKKRIHRIGQTHSCYYYNLIVRGSVEEKIYRVLAMRRDYTDKLFEEDEHEEI